MWWFVGYHPTFPKDDVLIFESFVVLKRQLVDPFDESKFEFVILCVCGTCLCVCVYVGGCMCYS